MIKVLLVEDDQDQIMLYCAKFEIEGLHAIPASTAEDALKLAKSEHPDVILLDVMLGNDNGLDIMKRFQADLEIKGIPVIFFSNYTKNEAKEAAIKMGAVDFVIKSDTVPREMVERIKNYFRNIGKI
jgi:DNA-binding response OmpR family regulator